MKAAGETEAHRRLKRLARDWALAQGFAEAEAEVRVPRSGFRADVAAVRPDGRTALFECKQSRADLLKDAHAEAKAREALAAAKVRLARLESLLAEHRPDLRRGEALWAEFDTWDFAQLKHRGYGQRLKELEMLGRRVRAGTKFSRMARYRCADELYLVLEEDLAGRDELPAGWGVLVRQAEGLLVIRRPEALAAAPSQRAALERNVAAQGRREGRKSSV